LAQLGLPLRVNMAVGIDDSRYNEFACEVKDVSAGWGWNFGRRPHVPDAAVLHQDRDIICGAAPVPSMTVA
jgi:hypothetical protein